MKTKLLLAAFAALCLTRSAHAQTTAFTYQGKLVDDCCPATGLYDLNFSLYDSAAAGVQVGNGILKPAVPVTNGLFTVRLDFGGIPFDASARWLQLDARTNNSLVSFVTLTPRTELTATPYAIRARTATGLDSLRVDYNATSPNLIGGFSANSVAPGVVGATIGGGGASGQINSVTGDFGAVGGGKLNLAGGIASTVAGGNRNTITSVGDNRYATIGGGEDNTIDVAYATIGGGELNHASGHHSAIGGGYGNTTGGGYATVPGGQNNTALRDYSFAAGRQAKANHPGAFVWGDSTAADVASTGPDQFIIRASGGVGIGTPDPQRSLHVSTADGSVQMRLERTGAEAAVADMGVDGSGLHFWPGGYPGSANSSVIIAGRVGIGRTPSGDTAYKLEVEGDAFKTGTPLWNIHSDARIKTNIHTVSNALGKLSQVRLVSFHYTDEYRRQHPAINDHTYLNVIAQEFQKIFPDSVKSSGEKLADGSEILQVDTYPLTIYAAAAIQELDQALKAKDARITELSRANATMENNLAELRRVLAAQSQASRGIEARFNALEKAVTRVNDKSGAPSVTASHNAVEE